MRQVVESPCLLLYLSIPLFLLESLLYFLWFLRCYSLTCLYFSLDCFEFIVCTFYYYLYNLYVLGMTVSVLVLTKNFRLILRIICLGSFWGILLCLFSFLSFYLHLQVLSVFFRSYLRCQKKKVTFICFIYFSFF